MAMQGIKDFLSEYVLGVPEKAILFIPKPRDTSWSWLYGTDSAVATQASIAEGSLRELAKVKMATYTALKGQAKAPSVPVKPPTAYFNMLEVQYNPKSLDFRAVGGESVTMSAGLGNMADNQVQQVRQDASVTLMCELVFSNVNISNAFMYENKLTGLNIDNIAGNLYNLFKDSFSVQPMIDGLVSTLAQSHTRNVIFAWGETIFRGELVKVDGNYKMFNKKGEPVLATANIEIRQGAEEKFKYDDKHWIKQFKKTFKEVM